MHEVVQLSDFRRKNKRVRKVHWFFDTVDAVYGDPESGVFAKKGGREWGVTEYISEKGVGHTVEQQVVAGRPLPALNYVILDRLDNRLSARTGKPFRVYSKGFAPLAALPHWQKPSGRETGS